MKSVLVSSLSARFEVPRATFEEKNRGMWRYSPKTKNYVFKTGGYPSILCIRPKQPFQHDRMHNDPNDDPNVAAHSYAGCFNGTGQVLGSKD